MFVRHLCTYTVIEVHTGFSVGFSCFHVHFSFYLDILSKTNFWIYKNLCDSTCDLHLSPAKSKVGTHFLNATSNVYFPSLAETINFMCDCDSWTNLK